MDFNVRSEDELLFQDVPQIDDFLALFLQELDILFSVERGTVMGNREFGLSIEHMLWKTTFNHEYVQARIAESVESTCYASQFFSWKVKVELIRGTNRDIGVITIHIKNHDNVEVAAPTFVFK